MTPIVLLILVVMWVAVLLPPYLRNRGGSGSGSSMHSFRRKLDTLERTAPATVPSAGHVSTYLPVQGRDLGAPQPLDAPLPAGSRHPLQGGGPRLVPMPVDGRPVAAPSFQSLDGEAEATYLLAPSADLVPATSLNAQSPARRAVPASVMSARAARKRRRDILFTLMAACGITLLMSFVLGMVGFMFFLLSAAALGGYLYLLVSMQKAKAERDIKVAFLPHQNAEAEPSRLLESGGGWNPGEMLPRSARAN